MDSMNATHRLDQIYMYIEYYQNISKSIELLSAQAFHSKVDSREITQKGSKGSHHS